jgi:hypothetical protein
MKKAFLLLFSAATLSAHAATYSTVAAGFWTSFAVWAGGTPPSYNLSGDTVIISHQVNFGSTLNLSNGSFLLIDSTGFLCGHERFNVSASRFEIYGTMKIDTLWMTNAATGYIYLSGTLIMAYYGHLSGAGTQLTSNGQGACGVPFSCATELAVNELTNALDVFVFPNPSRGIFTIESGKGISQIEIYNARGEKIKDIPRASFREVGLAVDLSHQPAGIYFVRLAAARGQTREEIFTGKLIIQK